MKIPLLPGLVAASLALAAVSLAQETLPIDRAQKAAELVNTSLRKIEGLPITVDPDLSRPQAIQADPVGILIVPDKALESAQPEVNQIVPVGQLWLKGAAISQGAVALPNDKTRNVVVEIGDKEHDVQLFILGATKTADGGYELMLYGKTAEPLLRVPVAAEPKPSQTLPIELFGHKDGENTGVLGLSILGKYTAELHLTRP